MEKRFEIDGKDYVIKITPNDLAEAKKIHLKTFRRCLEEGALLRKGLDKYLEEQGIWDETKEKEYEQLSKDISSLESQLSTGQIDGRRMKLSEGREVAIKMARLRARLRDLIQERTAIDGNTAEGEADSERFNYLVSACTYDYDTQSRVFSSLDDYRNRGSEELSMTLAKKLAYLMYGLDEEPEKSNTEHKFLRRFNFINENGDFIDSEGNKVDSEGNRLDDEGYKIDEHGNRVDIYDNPIGDVDTAEFEMDE
jgi:hypothetical protein